MAGRRGFSGARYTFGLNENPGSQARPSLIHASRTLTSLAGSGSDFGGIRVSGSSLLIRRNSSLSRAFPATAAFFNTSARVSNETDPLYVPFVWHLAQRALRIGTTSWAKSMPLSGSAAKDGMARNSAEKERRRMRGGPGRGVVAAVGYQSTANGVPMDMFSSPPLERASGTRSGLARRASFEVSYLQEDSP